MHRVSSSSSSIEPLEPRIAPATITLSSTGRAATWLDHDGDAVTLQWTAGAAPDFITLDYGLGLVVSKITLSPAEHTNAAFKLTVKAAATGDGRIDLGYIAATGVPLKSWSSPMASVLEIDAGNGTASVGTLAVGSLGTVVPNFFFPNLGSGNNGRSLLDGAARAILVKGDIALAGLEIDAPSAAVKSVTILGSLRGDTLGPGPQGELEITAGSLGALTIRGSIFGGDSLGEGTVSVNASVKTVLVGGNIHGGSTVEAGSLSVTTAGKITIGGSLYGSEGVRSGYILALKASLTINGSVIGGPQQGSGGVEIQDAGTIVVKGSVRGGVETAATAASAIGYLRAGSAKSITIGGDLVAGSFDSGTRNHYNGTVIVDRNLGALTVKGSILGNDTTRAYILAGGEAPVTPGNYRAIGKLTVGGDVAFAYIAAGHSFDLSATIGDAENPDAGIGPVTVGGNWFHSSLSAGITDATSNGVESTDSKPVSDALRIAVITSVRIKGGMLDNPSVNGPSGIVAEKIGVVSASGVTLFKSGDLARSVDPLGRVDIAQI